MMGQSARFAALALKGPRIKQCFQVQRWLTTSRGGLRPIKQELEDILRPACMGLKPSVVEAPQGGKSLGAIRADFALTTAMEMFRANRDKIKSAPDAAKLIASNLDPSQTMVKVSVANFYVNMTLNDDYISDRVMKMMSAPALDAGKESKRRVCVDYSSPNIAKQMHVGHLRSTLIGNSLANLHEFVGDMVTRVNHLGDWGTQFGTLLQFFIDKWGPENVEANLKTLTLSDITAFYKQAKKRALEEEAFAQASRSCTAALQSGERPDLSRLWKHLICVSLNDFNHLYRRLGVDRDESWFVGESFYQDKIPLAIEDLRSHLTSQDGALLLYTGLPEAKFPSPRPGQPDYEIPLVLRKSDGGVGYDATDVAAIRYRLKDLTVDNILYVTDSGQTLHFQLVFHAAKLGGWSRSDKINLRHIAFGVVTKAEGGRIRTREGDAATLDGLLNSARDRVLAILKSKRPSWRPEESTVLSSLAEHMGIFCVGFAELKTARANDYEFNLERMCSPDGDTGFFITHVLRKTNRILSKVSKEVLTSYSADGCSPKERALALEVIKFYDVVDQALAQANPHLIAWHLLSVVNKTSSLVEDTKEPLFHHGHIAVNARGKEKLALIAVAQAVMMQDLHILGLDTLVFRMKPDLDALASWVNADTIV